MAAKSDMVIAYIESLDVGAKVSTALGVSQGTVYKAIKSAEASGLVMTRPKTGTFRIDSAVSVLEQKTKIAHIIKVLGLTVLAGSQYTDKAIGCILVADGDEESVRDGACGEYEADSVLFIVGNRPEIQKLVMQSGANLLITGGGRPDENLIIYAEKNGNCILSSLQSTYSLLRLLNSHIVGGGITKTDSRVSSWMQAPYLLYYNDITADWHRLYQSVSSIVSEYPVVNDELELCGTLDIAKAFAANPSQKVSGVLNASGDYLQVDQGTTMQEAAEKMVLSGKNLVAVTQDGKMCGLITASDILRYYLYSGRSRTQYQYESFLEEAAAHASKGHKTFYIRFPGDELDNYSEFSLSIMLAAAKKHADDFLKKPCKLDNGTFFVSEHTVSKDGLMLSSVISRCGDSYCVLEVEMHDETKSCAKSILMFSSG